MREIRDLGLTLKQTEEILAADALLVSAWLDRVDDPMIENRAAWFLTGVRSGIFPQQLADHRRMKMIHLAERWIAGAGLFLPDEASVLHELFEAPAAMLRHYDEEPLREKMVQLYRQERPAGERAEREFEERMARMRASRERANEP